MFAKILLINIRKLASILDKPKYIIKYLKKLYQVFKPVFYFYFFQIFIQ